VLALLLATGLPAGARPLAEQAAVDEPAPAADGGAPAGSIAVEPPPWCYWYEALQPYPPFDVELAWYCPPPVWPLLAPVRVPLPPLLVPLRLGVLVVPVARTAPAAPAAPAPPRLPAIGIGDATVTEGPPGTTTNAVFLVYLSEAATAPVSVTVTTANGTATAPADFQALGPLRLTFSPGQTRQTVTVVVNGDGLFEGTETFTVNLSSATNATIARPTGVGTILDDDAPLPPAPPPALGINSVTVTEPNPPATVVASFAVTLAAPSAQPVTVAFATADQTATAGADYTAVTGTLNFPPGTTTTPSTSPCWAT
jgi:hypothetical protein